MATITLQQVREALSRAPMPLQLEIEAVMRDYGTEEDPYDELEALQEVAGSDTAVEDYELMRAVRKVLVELGVYRELGSEDNLLAEKPVFALDGKWWIFEEWPAVTSEP